MIEKAGDFQKNICFIDYDKVFDCDNMWKMWECGNVENVRWESQTALLASWEICMQVKKQQLELDMEQ